jgi:regulator of protease activity HflC (stomatin/prohibitin superfamily)
MNKNDDSAILTFFAWCALILGSIVLACAIFGPYYSVWQQGLEGKSELMKAEYTRQIAVLESKAKFESAKALAQAEVERAKGVSEANQIIASSLKDNPEYLSYLWVTGLQEGADKGNKTIYMIPSQSAIPAPVFNLDRNT